MRGAEEEGGREARAVGAAEPQPCESRAATRGALERGRALDRASVAPVGSV